MFSTDVELAKGFAIKFHAGQKDKAGADYYLHPERVASRMKTDAEKVIAWLHDVVEDCDVDLFIIQEMFGEETADAVEALTHRKGESWADYLTRVRANEYAKAVKIEDLIDNSNLSRFPEVRPKDVIRQAKYNRALIYLMDADGE